MLSASNALACEPAHIWEHTREPQRSKAKGSGGAESGEEARIKASPLTRAPAPLALDPKREPARRLVTLVRSAPGPSGVW